MSVTPSFIGLDARGNTHLLTGFTLLHRSPRSFRFSDPQTLADRYFAIVYFNDLRIDGNEQLSRGRVSGWNANFHKEASPVGVLRCILVMEPWVELASVA